jgi:hypothetical protein
MLKRILVAAVVGLSAPGAGAQVQGCLHGPLETSAERARREQAIKVAHEINALQASYGGMPGGRYRRPSELKLPEMPDNFEFWFYTEGRTYLFSLKDSADPCSFAVFSDDEGLVYSATPGPRTVIVVPAGQR